MDSFSKLLSTRITKGPLMKQVEAGLVVEAANKILVALWGAQIDKMAKALSLKRGTLTFECANSIISQEISFKSRQILKQLRTDFGEQAVLKLKIVQKGIENEVEG
jgi:hypothetical protein